MKVKCPHCNQEFSTGKWILHERKCLYNDVLRETVENHLASFAEREGRFPGQAEYTRDSKELGLPGYTRLVDYYGAAWSGIETAIFHPENSGYGVLSKDIIADCVSSIVSISHYLSLGKYAPTYKMYYGSRGKHAEALKKYGYSKFVVEFVQELQVLSGKDRLRANREYINDRAFSEEEPDDFSGLERAPEQEKFNGISCKVEEKTIWNWKRRRYEKVVSRELR